MSPISCFCTCFDDGGDDDGDDDDGGDDDGDPWGLWEGSSF